MRKVLVLGLALACLSGLARAQGPDTLSLWFDLDYTTNAMDAPPGTVVVAYLVLHEPTAEAIAGVEYRFDISVPQVFVLASQWIGDPIVFDEPYCTILGYPTPLPTESATLLASYTFLTMATGEVFFRALPCPEEACPLYGTPNGQYYCLDTVFPDGVLACLNCSVGTRARNWSAVRGLYR